MKKMIKCEICGGGMEFLSTTEQGIMIKLMSMNAKIAKRNFYCLQSKTRIMKMDICMKKMDCYPMI